MKKFFFNIITKSILLTVLPLIYSLVFPYALSADISEVVKNTCVWVSVISLIIHIIVLIVYGIDESNRKSKIDKIELIETEINHAKKIIEISNKVVRDNANMFHELVLSKKGHSDIEDWHLLEAKGDEICRAVYNMLEDISETGSDFSVSMMFRKLEKGVNGYTMLSRIATDTGHNPRSYRNFISESEAQGFYYKKIFDDKPTSPDILHNKREIKKHFKESKALNYSQYIAVPITCKNNKMVGILQIVAYNNSIIAKDKKKLQRLSNQYFALCATLMLLCDKYENVQQVFKSGV